MSGTAVLDNSGAATVGIRCDDGSGENMGATLTATTTIAATAIAQLHTIQIEALFTRVHLNGNVAITY